MNDVQKIDGFIANLRNAQIEIRKTSDIRLVKRFRDQAETAREFVRLQGGQMETENELAAARIRTECRLGELLAEMPKSNVARDGKADSHDGTPVPPTLADIGINRNQSSRWQAMAAVPEEVREAAITAAIESKQELTSREFIKMGHQAKIQKKNEEKTEEMKIRALDNATDDPAVKRSWEIIHGHCVTVIGHPKFWTPSYEKHQAPAVSGATLIFMDPPYNEGIRYGDHYDDDIDPGEYREKAGYWLDCCRQALTDNGSLWVLINHEWAWAICSDAIERGFHLRQWITWYESFGENCTSKFNRCSRGILWLVKDPEYFIFNPEAVTRKSDRQEKYNDNRANPAGKLWDDVWGVNPPIPRLVGTANERIPGFPTQLPLSLLRPIIACASNPGDLVIDPFSGSATTGAACIELGRRFIGIELSPEFVELSRLRLSGIEATHEV